MESGIYIVGNDRYQNEVRALINSIRNHDTSANICLIPYDGEYKKLYSRLADEHGVLLYPFPELLDKIDRTLTEWFRYPDAPVQKNKINRLRNLACWFGPYDRFINMDADTLVFTDILKLCGQLDDYDLVACDDLHRHGGKWVFTDRADRLFSAEQRQWIFNGGFWISRKSLFSESELFELLSKSMSFRECFDFPNGALAQPFINYLVLSKTSRITNLVRNNPKLKVWVGDQGVYERDHALYFDDTRCPYIHWAGRPILPGKYFYDTWYYYFRLSG